MLRIEAIPLFSSNYIWLITDERSKTAIAVDPGGAEPLIQVLETKGLALVSILITHSHPDHIGGLNALLKRYPQIEIYGPHCEAIPQVTKPLASGDCFDPGLGFSAEVFHTPGHLPEHIVYFIEDMQNLGKVLFSGDILFSSGCGRNFVGPARELQDSLMLLAKLDPSTAVYCAHEYTLINTNFALQFEPENQELRHKQQFALQCQTHGKCSLPTTIQSELETNPFLRCAEPGLQKSLSAMTGQTYCTTLEVFQQLRSLRNDFTL